MLITFVLFYLFADSTGIPPAVVEIVTLVVGIALAIALKVSPIPSRIVSLIGAAAGLVGMVGPRIVDFFPAGSRIPLIITVVGFTLTLISERIQGGVTVPEKRSLAAQGEM